MEQLHFRLQVFVYRLFVFKLNDRPDIDIRGELIFLTAEMDIRTAGRDR